MMKIEQGLKSPETYEKLKGTVYDIFSDNWY